MKHILRKIAAVCLSAVILSGISVSGVAATHDTTVYSWQTNWGGTYQYWVYICHWAAHPLPGGYGGSAWEAMHRAVNTWDSLSDNGQARLHFSISASPCGNSVPKPYVAIGMWTLDNPNTLGQTDSSDRSYPCSQAPYFCLHHATIQLNTSDQGFYWYGPSSPPLGYYDAESIFLHEFTHTMINNGIQQSEPEWATYCPDNGGYNSNAGCEFIQDSITRRRLLSHDQASYLEHYHN